MQSRGCNAHYNKHYSTKATENKKNTIRNSPNL